MKKKWMKDLTVKIKPAKCLRDALKEHYYIVNQKRNQTWNSMCSCGFRGRVLGVGTPLSFGQSRHLNGDMMCCISISTYNYYIQCIMYLATMEEFTCYAT